MTLALLGRLRLQGAFNALRRRPGPPLLGLALLGLLYWGVFAATRAALRLSERALRFGNEDIAEAVLLRSLESLFLVLALAVAFSVLTTAVQNLYSSEDLPFLLALPLPPAQVFGLKVAETYLGAALLPALFTLPVLVALGCARGAPLLYYPTALAATLALYALPVALGSLLALVLVRLAPAGRVKEVATAASVLFAALFVLGLRLLRPEQLAELSLAELEALLAALAHFNLGWSPSAWAAGAVWGALEGRVTAGAVGLALAATLSLALVGLLAGLAYERGWARSLEGASRRRDERPRPASAWERPLAALGVFGALAIKDLRLLLRDPAQWSQLLVLLALAGVYLVSLGSLTLAEGTGQRFRDALGAMNLLFLGFLLAGVGVRTAYPLVSLEGEGFWLLRTGPLGSAQIVLAKFASSLPVMLALGFGLGLAAARLIDLSPALAWVSPLAGGAAALATSGLGVGLGAAHPRFNATSPSEIPISAGGFVYMALATLYSVLLALLLAYPAYRTLRDPNAGVWLEPEGLLVLGLLGVLTLLATILPLAYGSYRLARYELGD